MRTYKLGSKAMDHEVNVRVPGLVWLGVKSSALFCSSVPPSSLEASSQRDTQNYTSQSTNDSQPLSSQGSGSSRRSLGSLTRLSGGEHLTKTDRGKATHLLRALGNQYDQDAEDMNLTRELQLMLMMDLKFEIQAVDEAGKLMSWLDERLLSVMDWDLQ
jgi:meiotic recombination protein SPO11